LGSLAISKVEAYEKGKTSPDATALTPDGNANAGWNNTGNLDNTKDDWFLFVYYTI
jgi:hypothetical protein